ncbi:hypothetical protein NC652_030775 [Populus alba x Populus x berolinensis]|nr:hypothetical protein NC652_030775 [Populus alba x Populus x berolinensis]
MDWLPGQWKMKNISSSHSIQVCCLSPFTSPVTVSGKRKAVLVSALHCCLIDPEKPSSRSRYEEEEEVNSTSILKKTIRKRQKGDLDIDNESSGHSTKFFYAVVFYIMKQKAGV